MRAERARRAAAAALVLALLAVPAGCGDDDEEPDTETAAATDATTEAPASAPEPANEPANPVTIGEEVFDATIVERTSQPAKIRRQAATPGAAAPSRLGARKGSCFWSRNTIWATATLENRLEAPITVLIQPIFRLRNAGTHGRDDASEVAVDLQPGQVLEWLHELGKPEGIPETKQPKITGCTLRIDDVLGG